MQQTSWKQLYDIEEQLRSTDLERWVKFNPVIQIRDYKKPALFLFLSQPDTNLIQRYFTCAQWRCFFNPTVCPLSPDQSVPVISHGCRGAYIWLTYPELLARWDKYVHLFSLKKRPIVLTEITQKESPFVRFDCLPTDYLLLSDPAPVSFPTEKTIIRVETESAYKKAVEQNFTLFTGPFIEQLLAARRCKKCPFGKNCSVEKCAFYGTHPFYAAGCADPSFLKDYPVC